MPDVQTPNVLNLDELFPPRAGIRVVYEGNDYFLRKLEDLGPAEVVKFQRMHRRVQALNAEGDEEQTNEIAALVADSIQLLCPELAELDLPFVFQSRVLEFYVSQLPKAPGKKARGDGSTPSPNSPSGTGSGLKKRRG